MPVSPNEDAPFIKVPPHSILAEQSVIGGLLLSSNAMDEVAGRLLPENFYRQEHVVIYQRIQEMHARGEPIDVVTVSEYLDRQGELESCGGLAYLSTLAKDTPGTSNIDAYAKVVREHAMLRELVRLGMTLSDEAFQSNASPADLIEKAESTLFQLSGMGSRGNGAKNPNEILNRVVARLDEAFNNGGEVTGLASGYTDLDKMTAGFQRSDLVIIAGRPSMGKTTFALNIAEHVILPNYNPEEGGRVLVFSMEMSDEQLMSRSVASIGKVNASRLKTGQLEEHEWTAVTTAIGMLNKSRLLIDDTPALTPSELRARARRAHRELGGLDLIVIDYLQLMQVPEIRQNRTEEISVISRSLKALAKELDVPVIALSQLNRSLEQRANKRPIMSDLRESGAIEQDADTVIFIYRDEVYNEDSPDKGVAEIIIGKQRNGPTGSIRLAFRGEFVRFDNFLNDDYTGSPDALEY